MLALCILQKAVRKGPALGLLSHFFACLSTFLFVAPMGD